MIRQLPLQVGRKHHTAGNIPCIGQAEAVTAQAAVCCQMCCMLSQLAVHLKHAAALSDMPEPCYSYTTLFYDGKDFHSCKDDLLCKQCLAVFAEFQFHSNGHGPELQMHGFLRLDIVLIVFSAAQP